MTEPTERVASSSEAETTPPWLNHTVWGIKLAELATEVGSASVSQDARALLERVRESRFFVACLGQFKRGKSTLINALLGEAVLPSGVEPVTSVVTVVRFGERRARVRIGSFE